MPLIVHLFSFRRAKKLLFPTLKFLTTASTQSKSKTRLKHYLILGTRLLLFASIVFLLWATTQNQGENSVDTQIISVDNSLSMTIASNGISSLDLVLEHLDEQRGLILESNEVELSDMALLHTGSGTIYSDFQGLTLDDFSEIIRDSSSRKKFVLVGDIQRLRNVYVDSLTVFFSPNDLAKQTVSLFLNYSVSFSEEGNFVVKLIHDGRQLASAAKNVSDLNSVSFDIPVDLYGNFEIELSGDDVLFDNNFHFTIEKRRKPNVVIIDDSENPFLKSVFGNKSIFDVSSVNFNSLDYQNLREADVVVINDFDRIPSGVVSQLEGKVIILFPAESSDQDDLSPFLGFNFLPKSDSEEQYEIDINFSHPLLTGVFEKESIEAEQPTAASSYNITGNYEVLLALRNNEPFLVKSARRDVYFVNTRLDPTYTNFYSHSLFLPLVYQMAFSSIGSINETYYYPGDLLEVKVENREVHPVLYSDDFEIIPEFNPSSEGLVIRIPQAIEAGNYKVIQDGDTIRQISVNTPKSESIMMGLSEEDLATLSQYPHLDVQKIGDGNMYAAVDGETVLWKYALILIILLLLTETALHRYLR